jgi:hypothetical protein
MARAKRRVWMAVLALALGAAACTETLDAGANRPRGLLPVDDRNPVLLVNDSVYDNWFGEYAILLANASARPLVGIVVTESTAWPTLQTNVDGWRALVKAARDSGLKNIPDPRGSVASPLVEPPGGDIDATQPNRSEGALFIVAASAQYSQPYRPLVIVTGAPLTDVADAYLVDPTVTQRVVVVSSLGSVTSSGGGMGSPNGDMDPWAAAIVAARFTYVQISAFYDQTQDVAAADVSRLPANPLGTWMAGKQPNLWQWSGASDQVAVLAVGLPSFATAIERVDPLSPSAITSSAGPDLTAAADGPGWLVTGCDATVPSQSLWQLLLDPRTFAP